MNFKSDNTAGVSPKILQALCDANKGFCASYGTDDYTKKLQDKISKIFDHDVIIYFTSTGTAANSLALSALVKPHEIIYCHPQAHINTDECGAPGFFTGGASLVLIPGENGKISPDIIDNHVKHSLDLRPHGGKPAAISVTQATEDGTVYTLEELAKIKQCAQKHNLALHMDGARFANALVSLGCTPAEMTWKSGIDILSFGATKNGALGVELIIFFNTRYAQDFDYCHKRAVQLMSKTRFIAVQCDAYLQNSLWLDNARHANDMAQELTKVLGKNSHISFVYPVQANELFVRMPEHLAKFLWEHDAHFYAWGDGVYRFVTSWATKQEEINLLETLLTQYV